jgi:hypothetical protein
MDVANAISEEIRLHDDDSDSQAATSGRGSRFKMVADAPDTFWPAIARVSCCVLDDVDWWIATLKGAIVNGELILIILLALAVYGRICVQIPRMGPMTAAHPRSMHKGKALQPFARAKFVLTSPRACWVSRVPCRIEQRRSELVDHVSRSPAPHKLQMQTAACVKSTPLAIRLHSLILVLNATVGACAGKSDLVSEICEVLTRCYKTLTALCKLELQLKGTPCKRFQKLANELASELTPNTYDFISKSADNADGDEERKNATKVRGFKCRFALASDWGK